MHPNIKNRLVTAISTLVWLACSEGIVIAADPATSDPSGTWKFTTAPGRPAGSEPTLKLKLEKSKLSGTLTVLKNVSPVELALEDAKLQGNEISFTTHNIGKFYQGGVFQSNTVSVAKYRGKIVADVIKGKIEKEAMGQFHTNDWEAKRVKE